MNSDSEIENISSSLSEIDDSEADESYKIRDIDILTEKNDLADDQLNQKVSCVECFRIFKVFSHFQ